MRALESHGGFNLRMVNNDQLQLIKLAAREDRGKLFNYRESKNFVNHGAILKVSRKHEAIKKGDRGGLLSIQ